MAAPPLATVVTRDDALFAELSQSLLRAGQSVRFCAAGTSMQPTIADGDPLVVTPVRADTPIVIGDIVLCRLSGGLLAHRVVRICRDRDGSERLIVRGDAKAVCDEPVRRGDVLGRVVSVERYGRAVDLIGVRARARYVLTRGWLRVRTAAAWARARL